MTVWNVVKHTVIVYRVARLGPVLDVSFPATKPWSVDSECNRLKTSQFSPSDKLPYYIPILVNLVKTEVTQLRFRN
ncbi:Os04g0623550 [Oryza sativa Japonica Group]|uniref:Os04g0623550 protein n=1 Tax=Oryza sativa subsp. japonica TaxID=39947 RepID=A0A0P0WF76_ORYSJ|nr:hypothetical protein EE612_025641 [Oryza sativa]BAS91085.1 Os04g0623550 [Oryza sativa Japonica Group]